MSSRTFNDNSQDTVSFDSGAVGVSSKKKFKTVEVQTSDDLISSKVDEETSSNSREDKGINYSAPRYETINVNEKDLYKFLRKVEPIVLKELTPTSAYQYLEKKSTHQSINLKNQFDTNPQYTVTSLDCNCTGSTVAVGLKLQNHYGFCRHNSQLYLLSTVSSTKHQIPLEACVTSIKFHPHYPAIISVGHHTGEITIIRNNDKWAQTKLGETHVDEIVSLDWLSDRQTVLALVSASIGGLMCVWTLKGRNSRTKFLEQCTTLRVSEKDGSIICLSVIPNTTDALVGLESGAIVRIPLPFESSLVARERQFHTGHTGPVLSISICPLAPGLFLSVGIDETLCMHNSVSKDPLKSTKIINSQIKDVAWSASFPSVVALALVDRVAILDLYKSFSEPLITFDALNAVKVKWDESFPGTLIVGCSDGKVLVFECGEGSLEQHSGTNRLMSQWEAETKNIISI